MTVDASSIVSHLKTFHPRCPICKIGGIEDLNSHFINDHGIMREGGLQYEIFRQHHIGGSSDKEKRPFFVPSREFVPKTEQKSPFFVPSRDFVPKTEQKRSIDEPPLIKKSSLSSEDTIFAEMKNPDVKERTTYNEIKKWRRCSAASATDEYDPLLDPCNPYGRERVCLKKDNTDPLTILSVRSLGRLSKLTTITPDAIDHLARISSHKISGDLWDRENLLNYLEFTWIRLLEQGLVLCVMLDWENVVRLKVPKSPVLSKMGLTNSFCVFNTGLMDDKGDDLLAILIRQPLVMTVKSSPVYVLLKTGFYSKSSAEIRKITYELAALKDSIAVRGVITNPSKLLPATYFSPGDPRIIFNREKRIVVDLPHITADNIHRLVMSGVIEEFEITEKKQTNQDDNDQTPMHSDPVSIHKTSLRLKSDLWNYEFRRGPAGQNSVNRLMVQWIEHSISLARKIYSLAVPQMFYSKNPETGNIEGSLQLIIPLYCDKPDPPLVMCLSLKEDDYRVPTVLTKSDAYKNARLLGPVNANWLRT